MRAVEAIVRVRPADVLRLAFTADVAREAEALVGARPSYEVRQLEPRELARFAGSEHHEGWAVEARARRYVRLEELSQTLLAKKGTLVALDRVRNPYNIGAIIRSAAYFGVDACLFGAPAPHPGLPEDAVRVAEGGAEQLVFSRTTDLAASLTKLRAAGFQVVGGESDVPTSALGFSFARPSVLVLGHEREGLSPRVRETCDALVAIPGMPGAVGSLNVSIAASVLLAELQRSELVALHARE